MDGAVLQLPWTKVKWSQGDTVALTSQLHPLDLASAHKHHCAMNGPQPGTHLYSYTTPAGHRPLTKHAFLCCCNTIWAQFGFPRITGHCFHIGGMTDLLLTGMNLDVVKSLGRWSSDWFRMYWRSLDVLACIHAADLPVYI